MYESFEIKKGDARFPEKLHEITDCPDKLHCIGNYDPAIFEKTLAVVGSRRMSSYGRRVLQKIVGEVAECGVSIVSGFMYGVDAWAHEVCVEAGGRTIAVLPYGIERRPPSYHSSLYRRILDGGGLFVSEFGGDFPSASWTFPRRNRIVAGLSDAVFVAEAALGSGSLITADLCLKYGRKLFALPGPVDSAVSEGTNNLLKEGLAAYVTGARDILGFFGVNNRADLHSRNLGENTPESKIFEALKIEPLTLDEICEKCNLEVSLAAQKTTQLYLSGVIKEKEGKFYVG